MTEDPIRNLLLLSSQTQADIGGTAVAQQQREAEKKSLKEKQKAAQAAKAAKAEKAKKATTENGRIGDRPYARGRSFNADHYGE